MHGDTLLQKSVAAAPGPSPARIPKAGSKAAVLSPTARWKRAQPTIEPQINAEGKHTWPLPPAFALDTPHLVFGAEGEIRMNRHDYYELLYVHSGELVFQVQERLMTLRPGDLFVMGSAFYHRPLPCRGKPARCVGLFFAPEVVAAGNASGEGAEYLLPFTAQDADFAHIVPAGSGVPAQVRDLIGQIERENETAGAHSRLYARTYLRMILAILLKHYAQWAESRQALTRKSRDLQRLQPLFDYMDAHIQERISLEQAAALANMSKSHFVRFFKKMTSHSFAEYLNRFRVAKAQALLRATDKPIAEISWEAGFCDQSHFSNVFRRYTGITPMQYRQSCAARVSA